MKILVIGNGGREHALVWKIAQSQRVTKLFCAPGNAGIADLAECVPIPATDIDALATFAAEHKIDLTIVGPEAPLCAGIVDIFQTRGLRIFGPNKRAAQLEGSKVFTKQILLKYNVPTAKAAIFDDADAARAHLRTVGAPIVVKADGLAAGKGVIVAASVEEADRAIAEIMEEKVFGTAGARVVIEECLRGEEVSVMAFVHGQSFWPMISAQDHKRALDGDHGPNTGGMGAYSPTPFFPAKLHARVMGIFQRTLDGLHAEGIEYCGVLYAGLMFTERGPQVLEFNCRFGDPETQVIVPRMDIDLLDAIEATIGGSETTIDSCLDRLHMPWKRDAAVCVVMAAGGYPGAYERGQPIAGLKQAAKSDNVCVFHAGTRQNDEGQTVTDGGRVLGVTGLGNTIADAACRAYEAVEQIHFDGAHFRRDIAARAIRK